MGKMKKKMKKDPVAKVMVKGKRLFDPRIGKYRKAGNGNPALILRDLFVMAGSTFSKEDEKWFKKMANYCDEKELWASMMVVDKKENSK